MPIFGMKTPRHTFVAIVTGMPHAYTLVAQAKAGVYMLFPRFELDQRGAYDDLAIDYHMLSDKNADFTYEGTMVKAMSYTLLGKPG